MDWHDTSSPYSPVRGSIIAPPPSPVSSGYLPGLYQYDDGAATDDRDINDMFFNMMPPRPTSMASEPLYPQVSRFADACVQARARGGEWGLGSGLGVYTDPQEPSFVPMSKCRECGRPCRQPSLNGEQGPGFVTCGQRCHDEIVERILSTGHAKAEQSANDFGVFNKLPADGRCSAEASAAGSYHEHSAYPPSIHADETIDRRPSGSGHPACIPEGRATALEKILFTEEARQHQEAQLEKAQVLLEKDEEITALKKMIEKLTVAAAHARDTAWQQQSKHSHAKRERVQIILFQAGREPAVHIITKPEPLSVTLEWYAQKTDQSVESLQVVRRTGSRVGQFVLADKEIIHAHADDEQGRPKYKAFEILSFEHLVSPGQKTQCSTAESSVGSPGRRSRASDLFGWDGEASKRMQASRNHSRSSSLTSSVATGSQRSKGDAGGWPKYTCKIRKGSGTWSNGQEDLGSNDGGGERTDIYVNSADVGWDRTRKPGNARRGRD